MWLIRNTDFLDVSKGGTSMGHNRSWVLFWGKPKVDLGSLDSSQTPRKGPNRRVLTSFFEFCPVLTPKWTTVHPHPQLCILISSYYENAPSLYLFAMLLIGKIT